ncbi:MAG: lysophospholipid acyltransferase family protein [Gammaproteobacteria bacterium]|nr:lysophospholipid acyltransferase family protein [Gammaproteobacteria bacterium]
MDALKGWLLSVLVRMLAVLPLVTARLLVDLVAGLGWRRNSRAARTTRTNIRLCFPEVADAQRELLERRSLQQTAYLLAEAGMFFHWPRRRWSDLLTVSGAEHIERARAAGQGVLILAPHFGNWECLALYLGRYSATALYDPPRIASLDKPLRAARERSGMTMLPIDRRGLRAIYEALSAGGVAALLPDQVPPRNSGVYAPFFGVPALTMTFAHRLIHRTEPSVLLGVARRVGSGFSVEFSPLPREIHSDDAGISAKAMNQAIEKLVRTDPAQYQWEYKRFRRQACGEPDPYRVERAG